MSPYQQGAAYYDDDDEPGILHFETEEEYLKWRTTNTPSA
jgi:hypothetical protein